jgi:PPIC-type PPIASE domain
MRIQTLLREPLLHFVLIGTALFGFYRWKVPADPVGRRIVITRGVVDDLVTQHVAARGREPSPAELKRLIESYVHDEILYREGVALGLDRDDIVVKRRVRQKIEVMAEEEAAARTPTAQDLSAYLAANQARFLQPAILTFEQVGKPSLLPQRMMQTPADLVARDFGPSFAAALEKAPVGEWVGPIDSSFGAHYVRVSDRTPAVVPKLADVHDVVVREWEHERRQRARNDAYARMRRAYDVTIDTEPRTGQP